jgi:hypothetical protein
MNLARELSQQARCFSPRDVFIFSEDFLTNLIFALLLLVPNVQTLPRDLWDIYS